MEWVSIRGSQSRDGVGEGLWGGDHGTWGLRQWWGAPPRLYSVSHAGCRCCLAWETEYKRGGVKYFNLNHP